MWLMEYIPIPKLVFKQAALAGKSKHEGIKNGIKNFGVFRLISCGYVYLF